MKLKKAVRVTVGADFLIPYDTDNSTDRISSNVLTDQALACQESILVMCIREAIIQVGGSNFTVTIEEK